MWYAPSPACNVGTAHPVASPSRTCSDAVPSLPLSPPSMFYRIRVGISPIPALVCDSRLLPLRAAVALGWPGLGWTDRDAAAEPDDTRGGCALSVRSGGTEPTLRVGMRWQGKATRMYTEAGLDVIYCTWRNQLLWPAHPREELIAACTSRASCHSQGLSHDTLGVASDLAWYHFITLSSLQQKTWPLPRRMSK